LRKSNATTRWIPLIQPDIDLMHPLVSLRDIKKSYQLPSMEVPVLHGIDLDIEEGEFTALVGASGSGKSTLMNILGFLDRPTSGHHLFRGNDVSLLSDDEESRIRNLEIGFVYQSFNLLPRCTARENVALPLFYRPQTRDPEALVDEAMRWVGLADRSTHRPNELSGGQRQRVAIARALVGKPSIILADEPTGALDSRTGAEIFELFRKIHRQGATILIVTHDRSIAAQCDRSIEMRDGSIVSDSKP
jgi:putative ABC transport system ATP-binding protein